MDRYDFTAMETKWARRWAQVGAHEPDLDRAPRPFYNLMMFPYPSAEGLHVGNVFAFTGSDVQGRYRRAQGYQVFEPMGFDAFGMHSENHALRTGVHPALQIPSNVERFRHQLGRIGAMFDWRHTVDTTDPAYYRWTQWLFLQLFRHGLAYRKHAPVTWCPACATVLADEQAPGGRCERCDSVVEVRQTEQWFLRITAYAEKLHTNLARIDWSPVTRIAQERWIGRSQGACVRFSVGDATLEVFTTRPDTLWGVTFLAVAPDHPLIERMATPAALALIRRASGTRPDPEAGVVWGVPTGATAAHPVTGRPLPVVAADYVRLDYGGGAVMGVPAHDRRDHALARALGLEVVPVVIPESGETRLPYEGEGRLQDSGPFTGHGSAAARERVVAWLEERGQGEGAVRYRLRDWCVSRQRYWGPPIPMVHCPACGVVPVAEQDLPVLLPHIEHFAPDGSGSSPLARDPVFPRTPCPRCGVDARRETDVSDNFLDSAWYYLRYPSTDRHDLPFDAERTRRWLPVSMYVGGNEHAVLHLLYTRFISMALHDMGWLPMEEPFASFRAHGLLLRGGRKMSKSRGNVVNPDDYLDRYGADVFRLHLMFFGDFARGGDFRDENIVGIERFVQRLWRYALTTPFADRAPADTALCALVREKVRRVTADVERLHYNTAVAAVMELLQALVAAGSREGSHIRTLLVLLQPFAPFVAHELWERLGGAGLACDAPWPERGEPEGAAAVTYAIQVDGRLRDTMVLPPGACRDEAVAAALSRERVKGALAGRTPTRAVHIPDRIVNLVTGGS